METGSQRTKRFIFDPFSLKDNECAEVVEESRRECERGLYTVGDFTTSLESCGKALMEWSSKKFGSISKAMLSNEKRLHVLYQMGTSIERSNLI